MEKRLKDNLKAKYTKIMANGDIEIDCGNGWYYLLDALFAEIQSIIEKDDTVKGKITLIKEKWGEVTIHHSFKSELIIAQIRYTQNLSLKICERCSTMNNVKQTKGAWISTICGNCFDNLIEIQKEGLIF